MRHSVLTQHILTIRTRI